MYGIITRAPNNAANNAVNRSPLLARLKIENRFSGPGYRRRSPLNYRPHYQPLHTPLTLSLSTDVRSAFSWRTASFWFHCGILSSIKNTADSPNVLIPGDCHRLAIEYINSPVSRAVTRTTTGTPIDQCRATSNGYHLFPQLSIAGSCPTGVPHWHCINHFLQYGQIPS